MLRWLLPWTLLAPSLACTTHLGATARPLPDGVRDEINATLAGRDAEIHIADRTEQGRDVQVRGQLVEWAAPAGSRVSVPPDALQAIRVRAPLRGALDGLLVGALVAAPAGFAFGAVALKLAPPDKCPPDSDGCGYGPLRVAAEAAIAGTALSLLAGPIIGAFVGHRTSIDFVPPPPEIDPRY